jgi:hypothetical protein
MPYSGMIKHVALVRTDVLEESIVFIKSVLWLLVTDNGVPSLLILVTQMEAIHSSETLVLSEATWCNVPDDGIIHILNYCISNTAYSSGLEKKMATKHR